MDINLWLSGYDESQTGLNCRVLKISVALRRRPSAIFQGTESVSLSGLTRALFFFVELFIICFSLDFCQLRPCDD